MHRQAWGIDVWGLGGLLAGCMRSSADDWSLQRGGAAEGGLKLRFTHSAESESDRNLGRLASAAVPLQPPADPAPAPPCQQWCSCQSVSHRLGTTHCSDGSVRWVQFSLPMLAPLLIGTGILLKSIQANASFLFPRIGLMVTLTWGLWFVNRVVANSAVYLRRQVRLMVCHHLVL